MPFTGLAAYDDFAVNDPDISEIIMLVSPRETPLLDALGIALTPATNVKHDWIEHSLGPDRIICSTAVNSATAATGIQVAYPDGAAGDQGPGGVLSVGMLLELEVASGNQEVVQISSIAGANSILVNRNVGVVARGVNSLAPGGTLFVISTAEKEGDDTDGDVSRLRVTRSNYTQIFKKPLKISGSRQGIVGLPNLRNELDRQAGLRTIELVKELEKAVIRSTAISTIGDDNTYRSMNGLRQLITSINSVVPANSFTNDPLVIINTLMQNAWNNGARDLDVLLCGATWGKEISATNASKITVDQSDTSVQRLVETITTDFGVLKKVVSPWMPPSAMMGLSTRRIFVPPLQGRNFSRQKLAKGGDYEKEQVIGEYTLELHHQEAMFQARV